VASCEFQDAEPPPAPPPGVPPELPPIEYVPLGRGDPPAPIKLPGEKLGVESISGELYITRPAGTVPAVVWFPEEGRSDVAYPVASPQIDPP